MHGKTTTKVKFKMLYHICPDKSSSKHTQYWQMNIYISQQHYLLRCLVYPRHAMHSKAQLWSNDKYWNMFLSVKAINSPASTDLWEHITLSCKWQLQEHLAMARRVKPKALINAGGPQTIQTPANGKVMTAAVEQELCRCPSDMASGLELPQVRVLKVLCQSTVYHTVHIFFHNFANGYINTLQTHHFCTTISGPMSVIHMKAHTWHPQQSLWAWIIIMLSTNMSIRHASMSTFGLTSSGKLSWSYLLP